MQSAHGAIIIHDIKFRNFAHWILENIATITTWTHTSNNGFKSGLGGLIGHFAVLAFYDS